MTNNFTESKLYQKISPKNKKLIRSKNNPILIHILSGAGTITKLNKQSYSIDQINQKDIILVNFDTIISATIKLIYNAYTLHNLRSDTKKIHKIGDYTSIRHTLALIDKNHDNKEINNDLTNLLMKFINIDYGVNILYQNKNDIKSIKQYIDKNYKNITNLNILCNQFAISKNTLINNFKKAYNITPKKYIINKKLNEATILLKTSNIPIKEISKILNFSSNNYFINQFSKKYNISPNKYRKKIEAK